MKETKKTSTPVSIWREVDDVLGPVLPGRNTQECEEGQGERGKAHPALVRTKDIDGEHGVPKIYQVAIC